MDVLGYGYSYMTQWPYSSLVLSRQHIPCFQEPFEGELFANQGMDQDIYKQSLALFRQDREIPEKKEESVDSIPITT